MFRRNLQSSLRGIFKNKVFSFIGIIGFAVGFSVCIIIGMYVYNEFTVDGFNKNHKQIYRVVDAKNKNCDLNYDLKNKLEENYPGIVKVCPLEMNSSDWPIVYNQKTIYLTGLIATTNNFFDVFSVHPITKLSDNPFMDENSAIITESGAKIIFGDEDPLGKSITIYSDIAVISAVIPDFPSNSSIHGQLLRNSENRKFRMNSVGTFINGKMNVYTTANHYILLEGEQEYRTIEKRLNASLNTYSLNVDSVFLQPLKSIYFETSIRNKNKHGNIGFIRVLSIIGLMILLLSVINYINYIISNTSVKNILNI
jgi:putative ABC transport system permease protein